MAEKKNPLSGLRVFAYIIGFGFVLTTILVVGGIKRYNENMFDVTYRVNIQKLHEGLLLMTNGTDFFYSPMFRDDDEDINYEETSGVFLKTYFDLKKYCGTKPDDCFAKKYKDEKKKSYTPDYTGACAILKNGTSICIIPQIGDENIKGIMDMNSQYGPNILGKDLKTFEIPARKTFARRPVKTSEVIETELPEQH